MEHGDEAEALALLAWIGPDQLDAEHGAERSEQLPQYALVDRLRRQIVHEETPADLCCCGCDRQLSWGRLLWRRYLLLLNDESWLD